jgi:mono/diheme cytochrome c family protein
VRILSSIRALGCGRGPASVGTRIAALALIFAAAGALSGCGGDEDDMADMADMAVGEGGAGGGDSNVPAEFADLSNPLNDDADALTAGREIYDGACAACHGITGTGGPQFNPASTDFTVDQSAWTDGYLFWRTRTGAASGPAGSIMPAYDGTQSEDETWQVITYLRSFGS